MSQSMAEALAAAGVSVPDKPRKSRTHRVAPKTAAPKVVKPKRETAKQYHERIDREIAALLNHVTRR